MLILLAYILSASSTSRGVLRIREEVPAADPAQEPLPTLTVLDHVATVTEGTREIGG